MAQKDPKNTRMNEKGEIDLSPERAFVVKRTGKQVAALQNRIRITKWVLLALLLFVIILYLLFIFFSTDGDGKGDGDDYGDFTVKVSDRLRNLISLSEDEGFEGATTILKGTSVHNMWHCTRDWIPEDIQDLSEGGAHNSDDPSYLAYTFYIKNCSDEDIKYTYNLELTDKQITRELDALDAIRVMFIFEGDKTVWANPSKDGTPLESDTLEFSPEPQLLEQKDVLIKAGAVKKVTVVMWLEGTDPECVNDIWNNSLKFQMNIDVQNKFKEKTTD